MHINQTSEKTIEQEQNIMNTAFEKFASETNCHGEKVSIDYQKEQSRDIAVFDVADVGPLGEDLKPKAMYPLPYKKSSSCI